MSNRTPNRQPGSDRLACKGADTHDLGWRLPSGQTLAEFALRSGFVAPGLLLARPAGNEPFEAPLRRSAKG